MGFWVGDCTNSGKLHGGGSDAYTGSVSMSRIFHVKVPKHQDEISVQNNFYCNKKMDVVLLIEQFFTVLFSPQVLSLITEI